MEVITMQSEAYQSLMQRMDEICNNLKEKQKEPKDAFLDNQEFLQLMNISKRTAQSWRDDGIISFSQVGHKIYYRMSDVQKLLDRNYNQAFSSKK
jgi:predicted lipase